MNEWMNECMNEWMYELINAWMNEWLNGWMNEWINEWMDEWMDEWMNEWMNECVSCSQIKRLRDKGELNDLFTFTTVWNSGETGDIHVKLNLKHLSRLLILVLAVFTNKLFTFFLSLDLWD